MSLLIAVDIGGTFTDLVAYDRLSNEVLFAKALTNYVDFISAFDECIARTGIGLADCEVFRHGTTLIINLLIQRKGAQAALITTRGFEDVLEIGRGNRPDAFNLRYHRDEPLIPRNLRFGVVERVNGQGGIVEELNEDNLHAIAMRLVELGVDSVAVSFLNSYLNPTHEQRAVECLKQWVPNAFVTCGTELSREWYEYERTATACANAYVGPATSRYIGKLESNLAARNYRHKLRLMSSAGGLLSPRQASQGPIDLIESGPVGGIVGAAAYARALGLSQVIAFDMGGTTAKAAMLLNGDFDVHTVYYVGGYTTGFPVRSNIVDIVEVGAGGGSIAWLDKQARLHVGPASAGSKPGPVAYGRGGVEPTVTDANIVLGRIDAQSMLGGELRLDAVAAARAIDERIAGPIGYVDDERTQQAAAGILAIANVTMANAIRKVTTERGHDPRKCALLVYGGGGPLHASDLARELHIPTVIVPLYPSNFSALGMLMADVQQDSVCTFVASVSQETLVEMELQFKKMQYDLAKTISQDFGIESADPIRYAEMRYKGQMHSVRIELPLSCSVESIRQIFDETYKSRHGHADAISSIEFVGLWLRLRAAEAHPALERLARGKTPPPTPTTRSIYLTGIGPCEVDIFKRETLPVGYVSRGPAIIEEYGASTLVGPDDVFEIGSFGQICISIDSTKPQSLKRNKLTNSKASP